jgi:hypothetical protein
MMAVMMMMMVQHLHFFVGAAATSTHITYIDVVVWLGAAVNPEDG